MSTPKEKLLVADDIAFARQILVMLLKRDYDVVEAADGAEAIKLLEAAENDFACVLLDVKMPGVDGYGVLDFMRTSGRIERIPVVALTSTTDAHDLIRCYESGAIDVIEKPYDEELLLYKLRFDIARFRRMKNLAEQSVAPVPSGEPVAVAAPGPIAKLKEHFRRLYGADDADECDALCASFLKAFGDCVERLRRQAENPDVMEVRSITHDLFGFAKSSGADDLDDLARLLNTAAKAGDAVAMAAGVRRILELYRRYVLSK